MSPANKSPLTSVHELMKYSIIYNYGHVMKFFYIEKFDNSKYSEW